MSRTLQEKCASCVSSKGNKLEWINTNIYKRLRAKKAELQRRKSRYAKSQNCKVVNEILRHGNIIKTENVSVKGWQKMFGKQISAKSPSFFQSELSRKAESAGGKFQPVFYSENSPITNSFEW